MGQVPAKYFLPPAPFGSSVASNTVNPVQQAAQNPQTPLLPPNFQGGQTIPSGIAGPSALTGSGIGTSGGPDAQMAQMRRALFGL